MDVFSKSRVIVIGRGLTKMCRLCLKSGAGIFSFKGKRKLTRMITKCTSVTVTNCDELPNYICRLCYIRLFQTHRFQKQASNSDKILRNYLQQIHVPDYETGLESQQSPTDHNSESSTKQNVAPEDFNQIVDNIKQEIDVETVWLNDEQHRHYEEHIKEESSLYQQFEKTEITGNNIKQEPIITHDVLAETSDSYLKQTRNDFDVPKIGGETSYCLFSGGIPKSEELEGHVDINDQNCDNLSFIDMNKETANVFTKESEANLNIRGEQILSEDYGSTSVVHHEVWSIDDKSYPCDVCNKCFTNERSLKRHKFVHTGEKPYQCKFCEKAFIQSADLKDHELRHTGDTRFKCDVCSKGFIRLSELKSHYTIHTGEKPYQCNVCNKHFKRQNDLKRHSILHTGDKPYQCNICRKSFSFLPILKRHLFLHTGERPFQCDVCNKRFADWSNMKKHKQLHSGERPFLCDVCNKSFKRQSDLKRHAKLHSDEKPFRCDICHNGFRTFASLRKHRQSHTIEG